MEYLRKMLPKMNNKHVLKLNLMILRSVNFSNQTPSRNSKALWFELASSLIDIEHYPLCITPHRFIDKKNAFSCKMFSCKSNLAFAFGSQIFFLQIIVKK